MYIEVFGHARSALLLPVRTTPKERLNQKEFHSDLAISLCRNLDTRRALGRMYAGEEAILRRWDDFLRRRYGNTSDVKSHMFQQWVKAMPVLTPTVRRNRMRTVRNFLLFHAH